MKILATLDSSLRLRSVIKQHNNQAQIRVNWLETYFRSQSLIERLTRTVLAEQSERHDKLIESHFKRNEL